MYVCMYDMCVCMYEQIENATYYGNDCECDNFNCPQGLEGLVCSGAYAYSTIYSNFHLVLESKTFLKQML